MVAWDFPHTSIQCSDSNSATACGPTGRGEPRSVTTFSSLSLSTLGCRTEAQEKDLKVALAGKKVHSSSPGLQCLSDPKNLQTRWTAGVTHLYLWDGENTKRSQSEASARCDYRDGQFAYAQEPQCRDRCSLQYSLKHSYGRCPNEQPQKNGIPLKRCISQEAE